MLVVPFPICSLTTVHGKPITMFIFVKFHNTVIIWLVILQVITVKHILMKWLMHSKFICALAGICNQVIYPPLKLNKTIFLANAWIRMKFGLSTHIITSIHINTSVPHLYRWYRLRYLISTPFAELGNNFLSPFTNVKGSKMQLIFIACETQGTISWVKISSFHGARFLLE